MQLVFVHFFIILVYAINKHHQADKVNESIVNGNYLMNNSNYSWLNRITRRQAVSFQPMRRIVGGSKARAVEYPFSVMLLHVRGTSVHCGASLVTIKWILSAAHCCFTTKGRKFRPNELIAIPAISGIQYVDLEVIKVIKLYPHKEFDKWSIGNDISLMLLSNPVQSEYAAPVQLATETEYLHIYAKKCDAVALGWGQMKRKRSFFIQYLVISNFREVLLPIIDIMACRNRLGQRITERNICTLYPLGGRDACQGDSGGPLMCGYTQIGILSWGIGCARPGHPGVSTRVDYYRDWINDILNSTMDRDVTSTCFSNIYVIIASVLFNINKCILICVS